MCPSGRKSKKASNNLYEDDIEEDEEELTAEEIEFL
jgi:hypothetical protein